MKPLRPQKEVLRDWAPELALKLGRPVEVLLNNGLTAHDFSGCSCVEIRSDYGIRVRISSAFALIRPEAAQAAVFSEHAGYIEFDLEPDSVVAEIVETIYRHDPDPGV
jgi:hypothetical protein